MKLTVENTSVRRRTLSFSYFEGALFAVMVGSAESFSLVYASKLGVSPFQFSLLATLPSFLGALAAWIIPLITPQEKLKPHLVIVVFLQCIGLIGLCASTQTNYFFPVALFSLTLYSIGGMAASPLWFDWIAGWLPNHKFGPFISRRNSFVNLIIVGSYLISTLALVNDTPLDNFTYVFILGTAARIGSLFLLFKQKSPSFINHEETATITYSSVFKVRWICYILILTVLFRFMAGLASPQVTPYMLQHLNFSIEQYVFITILPMISRVIALNQWGYSPKPFNPILVLKVSATGIASIILIWSFSTHQSILALAELFSGACWAGFELALLLLFQNLFPGRARRLIGFHNAVMNFATLSSAVLGGYLLSTGTSYQDLFFISGILRFLVIGLLLLISTREEALKNTKTHLKDFIISSINIQPSIANLSRWMIKKR